ncbi:MAG: carbohydrate-binding domain-containing protein [Eubacterium sp.]|nr:carbohydrate-binding domain-containing protein [Eubacterium sp.]
MRQDITGKRICTAILIGAVLFAAAAGCLARNIKTVTADTLQIAEESGSQEAESLFTERDMEQTPDLTEAVSYTVSDGQDIRITQEGVYVLSGEASGVTVYVEAGDEDKVQLVLDGVNITNEGMPCIYVKSADKVFVTTSTDSVLTATGAFGTDGDTSTDGAIFAKSDLVLNGTAVLTVHSDDNGIVSKDDLKITGGTYHVTASSKAFEANDSIAVAGGSFEISAGTDAFHAENEDDDSLGYIYMEDGTFAIEAVDDGIHANAFIQIDDGTYTISAGEGIEATSIRINGGTIHIEASDDGINAAQKSASYPIGIDIRGGDITVDMGQGDTDGIDSNGYLTITDGTISVNGQSAFDIDGTITFTGGTVTVNGQQTDSIPNQMMGGGFGGIQGQMPGGEGMPGGMQGQMPGGEGMPGGGIGMHGGGRHFS